MNRDQILELLSSHKTILKEQFNVSRMALFGSAARGTMRADSDIDILVTFEGPATSDRYFGVQFYLEDLLERPIDLLERPIDKKSSCQLRLRRHSVEN